jgi:Peptidase A4 family
MRHRWPALAAAIPLVFGGALVSAHPAAAQAGHIERGGAVQPGGPMRRASWPGGLPIPHTSTGRSRAVAGGVATVVTSSNWAGYAATGANGTMTSVSSSWTEPTGHCTGGSQYAAFWIGLDGYTSNSVEQTGSEVDCAGRSARYYAWYEMYPRASVTFSNPVSPGDHFFGSVTYKGGSSFQLILKDTTRNWTHTVNAALPGAQLSSAEVIAEAPCCTYRGGTLPLTNFGTAGFTSAMANGQNMATLDPVEITMPNTSVSAMNGAGNFTASYTGFSGFPWPLAQNAGQVTG